MTELNSKQRAVLRAEAHHLKPVTFVGSEGVTDSVIRSIEEAFNTRELIKVKVLQGAPEKARPTADAIVAGMENVHVPQTIGRTIVLYRPFPEKPQLKLPR